MQRVVPARAHYCNAYRKLILLLRFLLSANDLGSTMTMIVVAFHAL